MAASVEYVLSRIQRWTSPRLGELSDAELLERFVQRRDESAFAALVTRHGVMVLRTCRRVLGDVHEAEDAFQATFLILARKAHTLRKPSALPGFLHSVARRVARKARTKAAIRAGDTPLIEELPDAHADPLARLTARELLAVLDEEVSRLPAAQRSAVVLCCLEGCTQEEAARQLGCTAGSLKGHLERGRRRLQARLLRRGIALPSALAVVVVSRGEAALALLLRSTVNAALGGGIGSPAAALATSVLNGMFLPKLVGVMALVMTAALAASATVVLVYRASTAEAPEDKLPVASTPKESDAGKPRTRTDALGDPLPVGAIARLGTVRFRHGGFITFLRFTPDGKRLISKGIDGVRVWDAATGKDRWHRALEASCERGIVDLSADCKCLAATAPGSTGAIQFWDVDSGKKVGSLDAKFRPPLCLSPDGKLLAAAVTPTEIELWDVAGERKLRSWNAHEVQVRSIDFSADSRKLLTSDDRGKIHLWDAAGGRLLQHFKPLTWDPSVGGSSPYVVPTLSPDGSLLAIVEWKLRPSPTPIAEPKARISLWDTATGKLARQLVCSSRESAPGYAVPFRALTFTPDGKRLVTSGPDQFLRFWDPATGKESRRLSLESGAPLPLLMALCKDGKKLAVVSGNGGSIQILDMSSGKALTPVVGHLKATQLAVLTPDGRTAITGGLETSLLVWDVATGRVRRRLEGHGSSFRALQLLSDGRTLFSSGWDKTLRVWDLAGGEERRQIKLDLAASAARIAPLVSPDGKTVMLGGPLDTIRVLDAASGEEKRRFRLEGLLGMTLAPDGRSLAGWSSAKGTIRFWDVDTGRTRRDYPLPPIEENAGSFYSMALSPDGRLLAIGSQHLIGAELPKEHFLVLLDLASGREVYRLDKLSSGVDVLAFSPDGRMLAWGGFLKPVIRLLETTTGRERRRLTGHRGPVYALSFSANGERLLSGSSDTTALVWDIAARSDHRPAIAAEVEALWIDLAGADAARAYQAIHKLASSPTSTIPFMRKRLCPIPIVDEKRLARLIANLDSDAFAMRQKAAEELAKLGERALPAYRKALEGKPSLEVRRRLEDLLDKAQQAYWDVSGERLRSLRAVEALESAGTQEARQVLEALAAGAAGARLTEQAKAARQRLAVQRGFR